MEKSVLLSKTRCRVLITYFTLPDQGLLVAEKETMPKK